MMSLRFHVMLISPAALHELPALPVRHLHLQIRPGPVDVSELFISHSSVSTALPRVPSDPVLVSCRYITRAFNFYIFPKPFSRTSPDIKFICQVRDSSCAASHPSAPESDSGSSSSRAPASTSWPARASTSTRSSAAVRVLTSCHVIVCLPGV